MSNDLIIANLQVLLKEAQTSKGDKDRFRVKAYRDAIKAIKNCDYELHSGADAQKLNGVGKKTADKIQEIIDTGKLHQVEELGEGQLEQTKILGQFTKIWGVGPVKAKELWNLGARSIEDVKKAEYEDFLTDNQKIGLKYYHDLQQRVPKAQVENVAKRVLTKIREIQREKGWTIKARVCGSFRRRAETCGDMDVLVCETGNHAILATLAEKMTECGILTETLGIGPTKYLGITTTDAGVAFRIDMEVVKEHEWPFALLYFTGSGPFNERQRLVAKKKGYSLSEHGLKDSDTGAYVQGITDERDIFNFLEMKYLTPWERK